MGCLVEKTDTGVEVEIHKFDNHENAETYLMRSCGYVFDRHETWGFTSGIDFYRDPSDPKNRASLRYRVSEKIWTVAFWKSK